MLDACVNKIYNQCHIQGSKEAKEKVYFCDDTRPHLTFFFLPIFLVG